MPQARPRRPLHRFRRSPAAWVAAIGLALACTTSPDVDPNDALPPTWPARPTGALDVHLVFEGRVDLDLFVTGPQAETVYFGNSPARSGGRLLADRRCPDPASRGTPRRETIRFERPRPGRYRVGVEYTRSCRLGREPVAYQLRVETEAGALDRAGAIEPNRFDARALEFELDPSGGVTSDPDPERPR